MSGSYGGLHPLAGGSKVRHLELNFPMAQLVGFITLYFIIVCQFSLIFLSGVIYCISLEISVRAKHFCVLTTAESRANI